MSAPIPTIEPSTIIIGDTVAWTKSVPLYPSTDGWTLKYTFQLPDSAATPIAITATTSGAGYAVSVTAATTAAWSAGDYIWTSFVDGVSSQRYTVGNGTVKLVANPAAAYGTTHASRTLAIIETALEGRLPRGLEMYTIGGQQVQKLTHEALSRLRDKYKAEVKAELDAARVASGLPSKRVMWARFNQPL